MVLFKGSGVAIVTPFKDEGINYEKLGELIEWHIDKSTDAIIICGTTGESATMTKEEQKNVIQYTVNKVDKRIPVIAGTGSNNTKTTIEMSLYAKRVGADALLVVSPYYNKTTQKGLIVHYTAIADAVCMPIILYNVPSRTGLNIEPETIAILSEHPHIVAVKEASGNLSQVTKIAQLCPEDFGIYSGNDDVIIPTLSLGGLGVISVVANILPKEIHELVYYYHSGEKDKAKALQLELLNLINALSIETNPIPIKTAMNLLGMKVGPLRLPLISMEQKNKMVLKKELVEVGLELKED